MLTHRIRRVVLRKPAVPTRAEVIAADETAAEPAVATPELDIAANDPILGYLQSAPGAVELKHLELESPALEQMRAQGITMVVPLVTQGELIGMLNLGPRLSDQEYSPDDRRLLESLAAQAAPAVQVGQLVREQETEIRERERIEQELHVAQLIQQNFLPRRASRSARLAGGGLLPPGAHRGRRLLRLHRPPRRPDRPGRGRRDRQGHPRRDGDGGHPERPSRSGAADALARRGAAARERPPLPRDPAQHVRDLLLRRARSLDAATCATPTPATTCRSWTPPARRRSSAPPACRSG